MRSVSAISRIGDRRTENGHHPLFSTTEEADERIKKEEVPVLRHFETHVEARRELSYGTHGRLGCAVWRWSDGCVETDLRLSFWRSRARVLAPAGRSKITWLFCSAGAPVLHERRCGNEAITACGLRQVAGRNRWIPQAQREPTFSGARTADVPEQADHVENLFMKGFRRSSGARMPHFPVWRRVIH